LPRPIQAKQVLRRIFGHLKFKKAKDRVNELEVELYNKKCDQHKLSLEILQIRKVDVVV